MYEPSHCVISWRNQRANQEIVFFAVMLLLSIDTVTPALTEREVTALADIREGVGNVANGTGGMS